MFQTSSNLYRGTEHIQCLIKIISCYPTYNLHIPLQICCAISSVISIKAMIGQHHRRNHWSYWWVKSKATNTLTKMLQIYFLKKTNNYSFGLKVAG